MGKESSSAETHSMQKLVNFLEDAVNDAINFNYFRINIVWFNCGWQVSSFVITSSEAIYMKFSFFPSHHLFLVTIWRKKNSIK